MMKYDGGYPIRQAVNNGDLQVSFSSVRNQ
jgi:hypothetical protein